MTLVKTLMSRNIRTIPQDKTVMDAVKKLVEFNIGAMGITDSQDKLIGIFSERDLMKRVVAKGLSPEKTILQTVMTSPVLTISENAEIKDAMVKMSDHHIRHLPVVNDKGDFSGMLGIREVAGGLVQVVIDNLLEGSS